MICIMLRDPVQHDRYRVATFWSLGEHVLVAQTSYDFGQALVTLTQRFTIGLPLLCRHLAGNRPVFAFGWLDLAAGESAENDVRP